MTTQKPMEPGRSVTRI